MEDNELNSEIMVEILNEYGFVVATAENGDVYKRQMIHISTISRMRMEA